MTLGFAARAEDGSRVGEAAAIFDTYCLTKWNEFADIDSRATENHSEVVMEPSIPLPNGQAMRQKNWAVPLPNGPPAMLPSNDVTNLHAVGCGLYSPDLDGVALLPMTRK
jgi:hypothetical protein